MFPGLVRVSRSRSLSVIPFLLLLTSCTSKPGHAQSVELKLDQKAPFRFVAYGDTRFHDPKDTEPANPAVRVALVNAIAADDPAFVSFTGDIVLNGSDANDWKVWGDETRIWRDKKIPVYPSLGNHDLHGDLTVALGNYFQRFPDLKGSRYYSVRVANALILALDSSLGEVSGAQGEWLTEKLDHVPSEVDFVFLSFHHPPYTSSIDKAAGGGHSARAPEIALAKMLEERQARAHYRIVVFSGHVHNYERFDRGGVIYFVTGGGGARPYLIEHGPKDLFQNGGVNYHYLLVTVDHQQVTVTMKRLDLTSGKPSWTQPDTVKITVPAATAQPAGH